MRPSLSSRAATPVVVQPWWRTRLQLLAAQAPQAISVDAINWTAAELYLPRTGPMPDLRPLLHAEGLQRPVLLRQMGDGSPCLIISGFHRCRAAVALGWPTIDAVVLPDLCWRDAFDLAVADHQRDGALGVMAQAQLLGMSQRLGLSTTDSAHRVLGISARRTRQLLQLLQLPATLRSALERGDVTVPQALLLARWWPLDDPQLHQWIEEVSQSRLSLVQLRTALAARGPQALTVAGGGRVGDIHDPRIRRVLRRRLHAALHLLDRLDHATTTGPLDDAALRDTDLPQPVD